jgi:hypothetical protein
MPTARRSLSLPRPTPRTAAPSPRSRAEAQEPYRRSPHLRRAAPNVYGARAREERKCQSPRVTCCSTPHWQQARRSSSKKRAIRQALRKTPHVRLFGYPFISAVHFVVDTSPRLPGGHLLPTPNAPRLSFFRCWVLNPEPSGCAHPRQGAKLRSEATALNSRRMQVPSRAAVRQPP